ncbi:MAG: hypothetical protein KC431_12300, partial [Myxococcales bacterium]|nr:hypothetical protein [Myxococcales bacterium]
MARLGKLRMIVIRMDGLAAARYREMQTRIFAQRRPPRLDPGRVARALAALGTDVRDLGVCVHIGGTNGKGSCAAFVESIARCSGLRTALFTSPHLER